MRRTGRLRWPTKRQASRHPRGRPPARRLRQAAPGRRDVHLGPDRRLGLGRRDRGGLPAVGRGAGVGGEPAAVIRVQREAFSYQTCHSGASEVPRTRDSVPVALVRGAISSSAALGRGKPTRPRSPTCCGSTDRSSLTITALPVDCSADRADGHRRLREVESGEGARAHVLGAAVAQGVEVNGSLSER